MKRILTILLPIFLSANFCFANGLDKELDTLIRSGISSMHGLQFNAAEETFNILLKKYPDNPYGHFGLAVTAWARLEFEHEQSSVEMETLFQKLTEKAIKKAKVWIKKYPKDPHGYVCLGGMYGLKARLDVIKHRWVKSYFSGRKGLKYMKKAIKLDPTLYDAYIGPGMYKYYAGTLPAAIKILSKLFFISGNVEEGIEQLKLAKDKGRINKTVAKLLLIEIYTQTGSKYANPLKALEWAGELRAEYPGNPLIDFVEIVSLYESKKYDALIKAAGVFVKKIEDEVPFYKKIYLARGLAAIASGYFAKKDFDNAARFFTQSALTMSLPNKPNRWAVWATVRLGQIEDLRGNRKNALKFYDEALSYEDQWGFKEYIDPYKKDEYTLKEFPGQLPPP